MEARAEALRKWAGEARNGLIEEVNWRIDVITRLRKADLLALREIVARLGASEAETEEEDEDGLETEAQPASTAEAMRRALRAAIRVLAVAAKAGRAAPRNSKFAPVIDWLGDGALAQADLVSMGQRYGIFAAVEQVTLVTRNHFTKLPARYRAFRRSLPGAGSCRRRPRRRS